MTLTSSRCSLCSIIILWNLCSKVVLPLAMKWHPRLNISSRQTNLLIVESAEQRLATLHLTKPQLQKSSCPTSWRPTVDKCHTITATVMHCSMSWHFLRMKEGTCKLFLIKNCFHHVSFFFFFFTFSKGRQAKHFKCCPSHIVLQADISQPSSLEDACFILHNMDCLIQGSRRWNWENWVTQDWWWDNGLNLSAADFSV